MDNNILISPLLTPNCVGNTYATENDCLVRIIAYVPEYYGYNYIGFLSKDKPLLKYSSSGSLNIGSVTPDIHNATKDDLLIQGNLKLKSLYASAFEDYSEGSVKELIKDIQGELNAASKFGFDDNSTSKTLKRCEIELERLEKVNSLFRDCLEITHRCIENGDLIIAGSSYHKLIEGALKEGK